jgi:hypothetical protein
MEVFKDTQESSERVPNGKKLKQFEQENKLLLNDNPMYKIHIHESN